MSSRMLVGYKPMRIVLGRGAKIRFSPKASSRNRCIGDEIRNRKFPGVGRATKTNPKGIAFKDAVKACPKGS